MRINSIAFLSVSGLLDCKTSKHTINGETFYNFVQSSLLPHLIPFDGYNPPRAYRAAEGGERACNARSPLVDGEIQHVTKNNTSSHARECWSTDRKRVDTEEYGRLRAGAREYGR